MNKDLTRVSKLLLLSGTKLPKIKTYNNEEICVIYEWDRKFVYDWDRNRKEGENDYTLQLMVTTVEYSEGKYISSLSYGRSYPNKYKTIETYKKFVKELTEYLA